MLSSKAEQLIHDYFNLPFSNIQGVRCPYINNARLNQRGQLRVLIGKGTPREITEEAHIISVHYHNGLFDKQGNCSLEQKNGRKKNTCTDTIRKFLIDNNLGVECSGFVTHVLRAHFRETKKIDITKKLFITPLTKPLRWLISRFRPVENINVRTYTNDRNSRVITSNNHIDYTSIRPGDVITMLETGPNKKRNHILLIRDIQKNKLNYVHARAWTSEGVRDHGVAEGTITIINPEAPLLAQAWEEKHMTGDKNETYLEAKQATELAIRRLKI